MKLYLIHSGTSRGLKVVFCGNGILIFIETWIVRTQTILPKKSLSKKSLENGIKNADNHFLLIIDSIFVVRQNLQ